MFDERAFLSRIENAETDEFAALLLKPSFAEDDALRAYFGEARFQRLHGLALRRSIRANADAPPDYVVVIPDFLGCALAVKESETAIFDIWPNISRLIAGQFGSLQMPENGAQSLKTIQVGGLLKQAYGELLLSLAIQWEARDFRYDWRDGLARSAASLDAWLGAQAFSRPTHLVAHGLGGLVARAFLAAFPARAQSLGGRLLTLGTPHFGTYAALQAMAGLTPVAAGISALDPTRAPSEIGAIFASFPALLQMLPSPLAVPAAAPLYDAVTYENSVPQTLLDAARQGWERLQNVTEPSRIIDIAGFGQPTVDALAEPNRWKDAGAYRTTLQGDGYVARTLGALPEAPAYFAEADHGGLLTSRAVLAALDDLLATGTTNILTRSLPADIKTLTPSSSIDSLTDSSTDDGGGAASLASLASRLRGVSTAATPSRPVPEEAQATRMLTRGLLSGSPASSTPPAPRFASARLAVHLFCGDIDRAHTFVADGDPVDALAVGHYLGVKPQAAERALDLSLSRPLPGRTHPGGVFDSDANLLLTQLSERGIIRGDLGQPFFLPDPRPPHSVKTGGTGRLIAVAGMGVPGRFGAPELTVTVRELCWALGRMGKRHLTAVLIGSGNGNLTERAAVGAWLRGLAQALNGSPDDKNRRLRHLTFAVRDPRRLRAIQDALLTEQAEIARQERLVVEFTPLTETQMCAQERKAAKKRRQETRQETNAAENSLPAPTRLTVTLEQNTYRFGAITQSASIPERQILVDPDLVMEANEELAGAETPTRQYERGLFLEKLLLPEDLRAELHTPAPLVLMLDAVTARIHWEMLAQPDPFSPEEISDAGNLAVGASERAFLGTSRGVTRQLRTTFAPPPEPPPPPRRLLRVLVVADPAADAPLAGAEAEGAEVADLFERYNTAWASASENQVEVTRLFGPREATRTNVLGQLMLHTFDVLHFAGHCLYDKDDPTASGWVFTGGKRLTARELGRVDRVPKFVFSNACESGITADRPAARSPELAPSFAEAFFARGVSNFVCTAWPIDDTAARLFACRVYSGLLGLSSGTLGTARHAPELIYDALQQARLLLARSVSGQRTWGAYQHYGNPYFHFFDPVEPPTAGDGK